jgi:hypothetical protein
MLVQVADQIHQTIQINHQVVVGAIVHSVTLLYVKRLVALCLRFHGAKETNL